MVQGRTPYTLVQGRASSTMVQDQERSLKAAVATQEKKAHENWVAARQAERKLTEFQVSFRRIWTSPYEIIKDY